ncbi:hypothetical protein KKZ75_16305 [Enterobacter hormaechei subsp. xiangfangensis]|uniref:hypothetical protein n=1 Tax=Enterobacter hormaechei TaxID=158836 RepID=UPI0018EAF5D4|nr:hypothetical protein [Enterobacter hormaechei]ELE9247760.1 hypothetical protein [Enterobacter kobei]MBT2109434.1 hypothetical protein [Enterobacter hormaechei subsp. xiangfangensis]ELD4176964.1 hypothetical protein [Enterobacter hormaechei]MBJ6379700.1 hypothetical protein [Enterobacter hormaechei]MBJ6397523.1 hypothetical protein [Enterobacter hormaechei]
MLGDSFPPEFMASFSRDRGISPGDVLYLYCEFTTPPKVKFMVVVCCEPLLVLLINSEVNPFIQRNASMMACQVAVNQKDHDFLDWDSFVNCIEAHAAFDLEVIKEQIATDYGGILKGRITDPCMQQVRNAVNVSKTMVTRHKKAILSALQEYE